MKLIYSLLLVFGCVHSINAQVIEKKFNVFDQTKGNAVIQTSDGGFIVLGRDYDTDQGKNGALYFKLGPAGELLWHRFIHQVEGNSTTLDAVVETSDGSFVLMGSSIKYNTPDPGNVTSTILIKISGEGTVIWEKSFAEAGEMLWNTAVGSHMEAYTDGGVIVSINIGSLTCGGAALIRIGADGDLIWSKNYHGAGSGRGVLVRSNGELFFTGSINQGEGFKAHLTRVNPVDGTQIITRIYDFSDEDTYGREIIEDADNIYLAGHHDARLFLTKLTNDGEYNEVWSVFVGNTMDIPMELEIVGEQIVLAGVSYEGGQKSVMVMIDFDGSLLEDYTFSNVGGSIKLNDIALSGSEDLLIVGSFYESGTASSSVYFGKSGFPFSSYCSLFNDAIYFETATVVVSLPSFFESTSPVAFPIDFERVDLSQFVVDDYCSLSKVIEEEMQMDRIQFYPNPTQDFIRFESDYALRGYMIYDAAGKLVLQENIKGITFQKTVVLSGLKSGIYLIEVTTENGVVHERFIKQ